MLTQILVTLAVIVGAVLFTRMRDRPAEPRRPAPRTAADPAAGGLSRRALAGYGLLVMMVVGALAVFWLQWQEAHEVVSVRVVDGRTGSAVVYQVMKKDLGGREFHTVDGRFVSLGDGDRMELSQR